MNIYGVPTAGKEEWNFSAKSLEKAISLHKKKKVHTQLHSYKHHTACVSSPHILLSEHMGEKGAYYCRLLTITEKIYS